MALLETEGDKKNVDSGATLRDCESDSRAWPGHRAPTSGEGSLSISSSSMVVLSSCSPKISVRCCAKVCCCSQEQWFSRDKMSG